MQLTGAKMLPLTNSLGVLCQKLNLAPDARIADIGGSAFRGEETIAHIPDHASKRYDMVVRPSDDRTIISSAFPNVAYFTSDNLLPLGAYDLVIVSPPLGLIKSRLVDLAELFWLPLLKKGGVLVAFGVDPEKAHGHAKPPEPDVISLFENEINVGTLKVGQPMDIFSNKLAYFWSAPRKPNTSSYVTWVAFESLIEPPDAKALRYRLTKNGPVAVKANAVAKVVSTTSGIASDKQSGAGALATQKALDGTALAGQIPVSQFATLAFEDVYARTHAQMPERAFELLAFGLRPDARCVHARLTEIFAARRMGPYLKAQECLVDGMYQGVALFHRLNTQRHQGLTQMDWPVAKATLTSLSPSHWLYKALIGVIADQAARAGRPEVIEELFDLVGQALVGSLSVPVCLGCVRCLIASAHYDEALKFIDAFLHQREAIQKFVFIELYQAISEATNKPSHMSGLDNWRSVLASFSQERKKMFGGVLPQNETDLFRKVEKIASIGKDLIDIRTSRREKTELENVILQAVKKGKALSLLRLGDGESYAFSGASTEFLDDMADNDHEVRERMWWSLAPSPMLRGQIKARVRAATLDADVLGVPSIYRVIRDFGAGRHIFGESSTQRGIETILDVSSTLPKKWNRILTEERCHQILFTREFIIKLATAAKKVVWISCWTREQLDVDISVPQSHVVIPPHSRVEGMTSGEAGNHFFETFEANLAQMRQDIIPGSVVFVAAGLIGKIFLAEAKKCGAVALDIGAMADYLCGYKTRSSADLV